METRGDWSGAREKLHTGTIADVLDSFNVWGVLDSSISCVNGVTGTIIGRAYTVRWAPTRKQSDITAPQRPTWDQVKDFLVPAVGDAAGQIYVAGCDDGLLRDQALAGGFSATHLRAAGFRGIVLGGAIRDAHVVNRLDIPVRATGYIPADTQGSYRVLETGTWCRVGTVVVHTGDWIVADETGTVVIPAGIADAVLAQTLKTEATEDLIAERVGRGENLFKVATELSRL